MVKTEVIEALKVLPPAKLAMGFGGLCCFGAYFLEDTERLIGFAVGVGLFCIGLMMSIVRARAIVKAKQEDLKYREFLIEKGKPVEDDKTVIKIPD